jgi:hypothetical protein
MSATESAANQDRELPKGWREWLSKMLDLFVLVVQSAFVLFLVLMIIFINAVNRSPCWDRKFTQPSSWFGECPIMLGRHPGITQWDYTGPKRVQ